MDVVTGEATLQSDLVELKWAISPLAARANWRLQSDLVELKYQIRHRPAGALVASIGPCGIEMAGVEAAGEAAQLLQSDLVELKYGSLFQELRRLGGFNRTLWN